VCKTLAGEERKGWGWEGEADELAGGGSHLRQTRAALKKQWPAAAEASTAAAHAAAAAAAEVERNASASHPQHAASAAAL
jgi:peptidoglycan hydrolase CwlO-like protein